MTFGLEGEWEQKLRILAVIILLTLITGCGESAEQAPTFAMGALDISHRGSAAPADGFQTPDGGVATLAQFRGRPLVVNLWATWCAPCVSEMPALDKLATRERSRLQVLAISQDADGRKAVGPFFAKGGFEQLKPYLDPTNRIGIAIGSDTLPTTIFYDASGREQWRVLGAMDWNGQRAQTLLEGSLGG